MLRVTFLGTASSRPTVRRNVSSLAVQRGGDVFLFDCGEGTQRQMMRFGVGFTVRDVFISHLHADHYLGLPGLLRTLSLQGRREEIVVWGPAGSHALLRAAAEIGGDRFSFPLHLREIPAGSAVRFDGYEIRAFPTDHAAGSTGLALVEDVRPGRFDPDRAAELGIPPGPDYGRLQRGETVRLAGGREVRPDEIVGPPRPGRTLVYSSDTRPSDAVEAAARGADLLIHEATFSEDERQRADETRHATAAQAGALARRAGVARLILTHFSARHAEQPRRLVREARREFAAVEAAEDGMVVEVPLRDGTGP
ncbi:MAG: ribonuclease Z [Gemmatimonadota bacterium]|nr:ribonuclease Z [Gemmatimonadota bacterium]